VGQPEEALSWFDRALELLSGVRRQQPQHDEARTHFRLTSWDRGDLYVRLGQTDKAFADWEQALTLEVGDEPARQRLRALVQALRRGLAGDYAAAATTVQAAAGPDRLRIDPMFTQRLAWVYALAAAAVRRDPSLPPEDRSQLAETYDDRAMQVLTWDDKASYF